MPPAKTWYIDKVADGSLRIFTSEGEELKRGRGKRCGAILSIQEGNNDAKKGTTKEQKLSLIAVH